MQVDISGSWIYVYSGREIYNPALPEDQDPFARVQCINMYSVTDLLFDDKEMTITIGIGGRVVCVDFGCRPNGRINAYGNTKTMLVEALSQKQGIDFGYVMNLERRNSLTVRQRSRSEDQEDSMD